MWIDGQWVDAASGKTYTVFNPATEEEIAQVPLGDKADVDRAVEAARKAFQTWRKTTQAQRSEVLNRIACAIREHSAELAELDILDHGTPKKWPME
jgi:acyl-CoA reductase-like NAD-dependent aldehyde dehydrogenase